MGPILRVGLVLAAIVAGVTVRGGGALDRHVVLVSIDGFGAAHLDDRSIELPNIRALAAAGAQAKSSETVFPSLTHPSHTTLVTGVTPREHGVVGNQLRDRRTGQRFHITNLPRRESVRVPTLFDQARGSAAPRRSATCTTSTSRRRWRRCLA